MITTKMKGKKKLISSSYFDDIKELRRSKYETDYRDLTRNTTFDVEKLKLAFTVKEIELWRHGCAELSEYANKLGSNQLDNVETVYMGKDWEEYVENRTECIQIPPEETDEE